MAKATTALDVRVDGVRYRSTTLLDRCNVRGGVAYPMAEYKTREDHGVRIDAVWLCKSAVIVETYSIWDNGRGEHVGTKFHVADQHELAALGAKSLDPDLDRYITRKAA